MCLSPSALPGPVWIFTFILPRSKGFLCLQLCEHLPFSICEVVFQFYVHSSIAHSHISHALSATFQASVLIQTCPQAYKPSSLHARITLNLSMDSWVPLLYITSNVFSLLSNNCAISHALIFGCIIECFYSINAPLLCESLHLQHFSCQVRTGWTRWWNQAGCSAVVKA